MSVEIYGIKCDINIQILHLDHIKIKEIVNIFESFVNLKQLYFSNNQIEKISDNLKNLVNLQGL